MLATLIILSPDGLNIALGLQSGGLVLFKRANIINVARKQCQYLFCYLKKNKETRMDLKAGRRKFLSST